MEQEGEVSGWLVVGERRYPLPAHSTTLIGRNPSCDIVIDEETVSWEHALVSPTRTGLEISDLTSRNGTAVGGRLISEATPLVHGSHIRIGDVECRFRDEWATGVLDFESDLTIGRDPENRLVLDEATVSGRHALISSGASPVLRDLSSLNGTRVGGKIIEGPVTLTAGDEVGVGPFRLLVEEHGARLLDERVGMTLETVDLGFQVGRKTILRPTSIRLHPGEFVALIGPSGSGKTTLLRMLAAVVSPTEGRALLAGDPVAARQADIGYVPQATTFHERLTAAEAVRYTALLRLPPDTSKRQVRSAAERALSEVELDGHSTTRINALSGGQQRRLACALELVAQPTMLLLDEPTSGLDPPLERNLMTMFRSLADAGRGIVIVTHATSSLALCDLVAVMAPGGELRYFGPPTGALEYFSASTFEEIYDAISTGIDRATTLVKPRP